MENHWQSWLYSVFSSGGGTPVEADFDDFINQDKYEADVKACDKRMYTYWDKCVPLPPKKEPACREKAVRLNARCKQAAEKNALYIVNLPEEARIEYARIYTKQEKAAKKCDARAEKAIAKCDKFSSNAKKEKACKDKVIVKYITCRENALIKNTFETRKMKKLLKGQRP